ncbi:hypothetical protein [Rhizorhabdus dicambivorans]|uniref:Uncharacterized protein n=1 Tax=Rhizorhabdus dicambivorans TaxID=1850238 RepID=A0A2A4FZV5_9SPHN|nr:hypothetical protein [Rhizorhabdus dicambivorans]ATE63090.1 hypothetical protein CMV14_00655 [Rhizorhabdus dicambivorans]PCE43267.1 hypothetical protein COO09_05690 [Rhizorhabdus dicambivorans]
MAQACSSDLLALLADELDAARGQLEALGQNLISDQEIAARHVIELQAIDHVGQRCASIATILRGDDAGASRAAPLETIIARVAALRR